MAKPILVDLYFFQAVSSTGNHLWDSSFVLFVGSILLGGDSGEKKEDRG